MSIPHLSLQDARHLQLAAQGLLAPRRSKATPADLLATIRRMALLQIDTISVVARSPYLVLFSRLGQYEPRWLEQLVGLETGEAPSGGIVYQRSADGAGATQLSTGL